MSEGRSLFASVGVPATAPVAGGINIEGYGLILALAAIVILFALAGGHIKRWATAEVARDVAELKHDTKNDRSRINALEKITNDTSKDIVGIKKDVEHTAKEVGEVKGMVQKLLDKSPD